MKKTLLLFRAKIKRHLKKWRCIRCALHSMVGLPDYEAYLRARKKHHPDSKLMSFEDFFRHCQKTRYQSRSGKCC